MSPEAQAWRARLKCRVRMIDEIFEDALHEAQSVLSPAGLESWLASADRICHLGRGTDLVLIFLEEMPEVVRHSDEAIITDTAHLAVHLSRLALGTAIRPFLATLPAVARRLASAASLRGWLQLVKRVAEEAAQGTAAMLEQAPRLFGQTSLAGVERWVEYGLRVYRDQPHRLPDYFGLHSADARAMLTKQRGGTLFIDHERHLRLLMRALWNLETEFRPYSEAFDIMRMPRPHLDRLGFHLPDVYNDRGSVSGIDRYRAAIAHMAGHRLWSKPYLADNFSPFQQLCVEVFEDARIEHLMMQRYPGLRGLWQALHPKPEPEECPSGWSCIRHKLAMLSYALLVPDHDYQDAGLLDFVARFRVRVEADPYDTTLSTDLGVAWLTAHDEPDFRRPNIWFENTEVSYRDDNRTLWLFLENVEEEADFHSDHGARDNRKESESARTLSPRHYPEWDYTVQSERPDWVTLYEAIQPAGDASVIDRLLEEHRLLIKDLRRIVDRLKPQLRRRIRAQEEGDEFDSDALIRAAIDQRIGAIPDTRVYQSQVKAGRDLSVLLLLDLSESIKETPPGADHSILQLSLEAVALLATAVEALGDPFAIAGFSSNTRHDVRYLHFKGFNEPWSDAAKGRLAALSAGHSTRMGAALRHAARSLQQRREQKKLLLLLTDGEPYDIDIQDPRYLRDDTHKAVDELACCGIGTFCITLDPDADDYVADIFGRHNYAIIDRVERLPERLPRLFMALTR